MLTSTLLALASAALASAHTVITYPGWRGNNLKDNEEFPYGMQWTYPCGGLTLTQNRTYWPTTGGAISFQPGWFQGHATAFIYVNLGVGNDGPDGGPKNMSFPMVSPFQIIGPGKNPYPGTFCLPQVSTPAGFEFKEGDNATIQLVELAIHGAALYSCVDITFVPPGDPRVAQVNESNCFNSTDLGAADLYTINILESGRDKLALATSAAASLARMAGWVPLVAGGLWMML
ncbi:hypothetical protein QR685DRAFT_432380 [Neurospora intermedia]|uniref:Copper acquisition factor BIM1-like domain-containing protein n=1 Tax=Neurospora intermedia TaxID=5142 RepID=A0ABR3DQR0_NEUIN